MGILPNDNLMLSCQKMLSCRRLVRLRKLTELFSLTVTVVILSIFRGGILRSLKNFTGTLSMLTPPELNMDLEDCSLRFTS